MSRLLPLFRNIRFYAFTGSLLVAVLSFFIVTNQQQGILALQQLARIYALLAVAYLYVTLLGAPLYSAFPGLPGKEISIKLGRPLGVMAFVFGALHAYFAFFDELGGFAGLGFLNQDYIIAITLSSIALLILTVLAVTSFDWVIQKLTFPRWKKLHNFVYWAGVFIVIHALMLGSDFVDLSQTIPTIFLTLLGVLLLLQAMRVDQGLLKRWDQAPRFGWPFVILVVIIVVGLLELGGSAVSTHASHNQIPETSTTQAE